jgi:membrane protein
VSDAGGIGALPTRVRDWADRVQQRHSLFGFPYAVVKKYGDDEGARHAALLTYYGFLSIFPLLLLVVVVVSTVLQGNQELRMQLIDAIVPEQFRTTVENALVALPTTGLPLIVAVVGLLFSGLGIVFSAYHTLNQVASVPHRQRLEFFPRYVRIVVVLVLLVLCAIGIGTSTAVMGALPDLPGLSRAGAVAASVTLVFLLLWVTAALLLPHRARLTIVWPAALAGSLVIVGVLTFGTVALTRLVARSGAVYGSFATIVGLFSLLYVVTQVMVFAAEVAIVRRRRLWPRSLDALSPTPADRRALTYLARVQERIAVERIETRFDAPSP